MIAPCVKFNLKNTKVTPFKIVRNTTILSQVQYEPVI